MIVILTALEVEHDAILQHLTDVQPYQHREGTYFDIGTLRGQPVREIALAGIEIGNLAAAALAERANSEFRPSTMMFVGVAGGLRDWLELGDVVVGTRIYDYHGGLSKDAEFLNRPQAWNLSHAIHQSARRIDRDESWRESLPQPGLGSKPRVHFGPIAAGSILLDSKTSAVADHIHRNYNDAVAIEMESAGFAEAALLNASVPSVTIRGISDHAGGEKNRTDQEGWQPIAARNAAAFAVALARSLVDEPRSNQGVGSLLNPIAQGTGNVATGNATVGQQIGTNHGSSTFTFGQAKDTR